MNEYDDIHEDNSLAPRTWDTYIGQEKIKERLQVSIQGALDRYEPLKHVLLLGQAGSGKTSLAEIISKEMHADLLALTMTPNFKMHFLYKKLQDFEGGICFLDEIHCLSKKSQHYLLDVLEKRKMTFDSGKVVHLHSPISFIGATTEQDKLITPLYERFPLRHTLEDYSELEMAKIVERMALQIGIQPTKDACIALGKASAGVPRQARRLVFAAQDLGSIEYIDDILDTCGVTPDGLTEDHIAYMKALYELGGKAGIVNLSNHSHRPREIVENLEKLLVTRSYVEITPGGRELSYEGLKALKDALTPKTPVVQFEEL